MNNKRVVLIGPIFLGQVATNGGAIKNQYFLERFREVFDEVIPLDRLPIRQNPFHAISYSIKLLYYAIFYRNTKVVISQSIKEAYKDIRLFYHTRRNKNVYYWTVGGSLAERIVELHHSLKYYESVEKIYVQGQSMIPKLNSLGLENVVWVPNSKKIPSLPQKTDNYSGSIKFVFVSRINPTKGIKEISECAKILDENGYGKKYKIDFYGTIHPGYEIDFRRVLDSSVNMEYKGFLNLKDSGAYEDLAKYDVMLFPTYWQGEGFPGAIIDAYIAGLPVIATDWNMNKEVVLDGKTGVIVKPHDTESLLEAMTGFIEGKYDLKRMSINSQERAAQFDNRKVLSIENLRRIGFID